MHAHIYKPPLATRLLPRRVFAISRACQSSLDVLAGLSVPGLMELSESAHDKYRVIRLAASLVRSWCFIFQSSSSKQQTTPRCALAPGLKNMPVDDEVFAYRLNEDIVLEALKGIFPRVRPREFQVTVRHLYASSWEAHSSHRKAQE